MALTHARLREIKLRNCASDLKELIAHAEETLGPADPLPVTIAELDADGKRIERELSAREIKALAKEDA